MPKIGKVTVSSVHCGHASVKGLKSTIIGATSHFGTSLTILAKWFEVIEFIHQELHGLLSYEVLLLS